MIVKSEEGYLDLVKLFNLGKEVYSLGKLVGANKGFDSAIGAICDINPELAVQIAEEAIKQGK